MQGSASKVNRIRRCLHAFYYSDKLGLERKVRSLAPYKGQLIHKALEMHYTGKDWTDPLRNIAINLDDVFDEERAEWASIAGDVYTILKTYLTGYREADKSIETLATEHYFEIPIGKHTYRGYIDWVYLKDGMVHVSDHKSSSRIPSDNELYMDIQTLIYYDALRNDPKLQALVAGRKLFPGAVFNYIKTKAPKKPKPLKNGGLSKEAIDTDVTTYFAEVRALGLNIDDYADMVEKLKKNVFYKRIKIPASETTLTILKEEIESTLDMAEELLKHDDIKYYPRTMIKQRCEWDCPYRQICFAELAGMDTSLIIAEDYVIKTEREETEDGE